LISRRGEPKWHLPECILDPKHLASISGALLIHCHCQFVEKVEVKINDVGENRYENVFIFFPPLYAFIILFLKLILFS
jgi:hypothetical protein